MDFDRFLVSRGHQKWAVFEDGDQQIRMIFDICFVVSYVFVRNGITLQSMFSYRLLCQKDHPAVDKVLKFIITGWGEFPKVVNPFPLGTED